MIVFDSDDFPPADRVEAHRTFAYSHVSPCEVVHDVPGHALRLRQELTRYGPVTHIATAGTGLRLVRTARHIQQTTEGAISITTQRRGRGRYTWSDHEQEVGPGALMLTDRTAEHAYSWAGPGADGRTDALMVGTADIALPEDAVRTAIPRVALSPLAPLIAHQATVLGDGHAALASGRQGRALGDSAVELLRALIMSVADEGPLRRDVARDSLIDRILAYIHLHHADPALAPVQIAAAHHISLRTLHRLCGQAGISLEQEIIEHRLRAVRRALADPAGRHRTIGAIARSCGLTSMSFFTRRFRRAYGCTPTEWRRAALAGAR